MNLIIDGSSLLHRCHWVGSYRNMASESNDIFLFLNGLKSYVKLFSPNPKNIYVAWDKKILWPSTNFRSATENVEYKSNRNKDDAHEVYQCEEKLTEILSSLGIKEMYPRIMEADDVIAWLAHNLSEKSIVVTCDKDMLQLVSKNISVYLPNKEELVDVNSFKESIGMDISTYILYKAIMGDPSDNIKGLVGYGKVKAKILAESYDESKLTKEQVDIVNRNLNLVDLSKGYILAGPEEVECYNEQLKAFTNTQVDLNTFKEFCKKHSFNTYLKNFSEWENIFGVSRLISLIENIR